MTLPPLPNFLIVGAQKSGTRWLRLNLGLHPDVFSAPRELEFFNHNFDRGARWYRQRFDGWRAEHWRGESTPGYMIWNERPHVQAARIDGMLPDVRVFSVLRNPVDRTYSAYVHHQTHGRIDPQTSLLDHLDRVDDREDPLALVSGSWYGDSLAPYLRRFGARLHVLLQEDIRTDPAGCYDRATRHLDLHDDFLPEELAMVRFSNTVPADSVARQGSGRRTLESDERAALAQRCADDVARLRRLLPGLDLTAWSDDFPAAVS